MARNTTLTRARRQRIGRRALPCPNASGQRDGHAAPRAWRRCGGHAGNDLTIVWGGIPCPVLNGGPMFKHGEAPRPLVPGLDRWPGRSQSPGQRGRRHRPPGKRCGWRSRVRIGAGRC